MASFRALALLVLAACTDRGGELDRDDRTSPPGPPDDSGASSWFEVGAIYLEASVGFDGARAITADVEGQSVPPRIEYTLATSEWDGTLADLENYCQIALPLIHAQRNVLDKQLVTRLWFALDWVPELDPALTTCNTEGYELDPALWGDPVDLFTRNTTHFVGVGEQSALVQDWLRSNAPDLELVGGSFGLPSFLAGGGGGGVPPRTDDVYAFAYAMDPSGRLLVDNGELVELTPEELRTDPLQPAYYRIRSLFYWPL